MNKIRQIPDEVASLTHVRRLDMAQNLITILPSSIGSLSKLQNLCVSSNQLESLPSTLWRLPSLRALDVSFNNLTNLNIPNPENKSKDGGLGPVGRALESLDMSHNQFTVAPSSLGLFVGLTDLNMGFNSIKSIPEGFSSLKKLRVLNLEHNKMSGRQCVPRAVLEDTSVFRVELKGNPVFEGSEYYHLEGFSVYEQRSKAKGDKQVQGGLAVTTT